MLLAYAQLAAAMALVGANVGVAKVLSEALPIALIAFLRCLLACVVLWPLARARDGRGAVPGRAAGRRQSAASLPLRKGEYSASASISRRIAGRSRARKSPTARRSPACSIQCAE